MRKEDNENVLDVFKDPEFRMMAPVENAIINGTEKIKYQEHLYKGAIVYYLYIKRDTIESESDDKEPDYKVTLGFHSRKLIVAYSSKKPLTEITNEKEKMYLENTISQIHKNNLNNYLSYLKMKLNRKDMVYLYVKYLEYIHHLTPEESDTLYRMFLNSSTKIQCSKIAQGGKR